MHLTGTHKKPGLSQSELCISKDNNGRQEAAHQQHRSEAMCEDERCKRLQKWTESRQGICRDRVPLCQLAPPSNKFPTSCIRQILDVQPKAVNIGLPDAHKETPQT